MDKYDMYSMRGGIVIFVGSYSMAVPARHGGNGLLLGSHSRRTEARLVHLSLMADARERATAAFAMTYLDFVLIQQAKRPFIGPMQFAYRALVITGISQPIVLPNTKITLSPNEKKKAIEAADGPTVFDLKNKIRSKENGAQHTETLALCTRKIMINGDRWRSPARCKTVFFYMLCHFSFECRAYANRTHNYDCGRDGSLTFEDICEAENGR